MNTLSSAKIVEKNRKVMIFCKKNAKKLRNEIFFYIFAKTITNL